MQSCRLLGTAYREMSRRFRMVPIPLHCTAAWALKIVQIQLLSPSLFVYFPFRTNMKIKKLFLRSNSLGEKFLTRFTQEKEQFNVKLAQCGHRCCRCKQMSNSCTRFICTHYVRFTRPKRTRLTVAIYSNGLCDSSENKLIVGYNKDGIFTIYRGGTNISSSFKRKTIEI